MENSRFRKRLQEYFCHVAGPDPNFQTRLSALRNALSFAPPWAVSFVVLVSAVVVALLIHAAILALVHRLLRRPYL